MDMKKAEEISQLIKQIERSESFLQSLYNRDYEDEFSIYYRGAETCELEPEALYSLIDFYKKKQQDAKEKLKSI